MRRVRIGIVAAFVLVAAVPTGSVFASPTATLPGAVVVSVDLSVGRHPISDNIYGLNFAEDAFATEIGSPVDRWGGDSTERYNWSAGVTNTGNNYYFENLADCWDAAQDYCSKPGHESYRSWQVRFDSDQAHARAPLVTLPMLGFVSANPKYAHPFDCSYPRSVVLSSAYDPYDLPCGNGRAADGSFVGSADPSLTSVNPGYQALDGAWIDALKARYGGAKDGGVHLYELGNEPGLWSDTHHDVRPTRLGYDEEYAKASALAAVVKAHDRDASVLGPSDWGWLAYRCSDLDLASNTCDAQSPDRAAHGGKEFAAWYLAKFAAYQAQTGVRALDYFDEHYYPQGGSTPDITRSLWDPTYTDPSWINDKIALIPRMHAWVDQNYPGTKIAISEYNFGHGKEMLGAILQADALGIFGREGVDLATMWGPPASTEPAAFAFRMYRNFDGHGARFGNVGVRASSMDQSQVAVYASQRSSDGAATVLLINKTDAPQTVIATISGTSARTAVPYEYSAADPGSVHALPPVPLLGASAGARGVVVLPPLSITTLLAR
ncbi:MAG: hypothetical protein NVSMB57_06800 [Actinomycetota bacterium]